MYKIKEITTPGYNIIVELFSEQEVSGTSLILSAQNKESNHARVIGVGPLVQKDCGIKVGDVVLLNTSTLTMLPNPTGNGKKWISTELHAIKAVLVIEQ